MDISLNPKEVSPEDAEAVLAAGEENLENSVSEDIHGSGGECEECEHIVHDERFHPHCQVDDKTLHCWSTKCGHFISKRFYDDSVNS